MPSFDTPEPITMTVEVGIGDIRIEAGDRADTVVEVRPGDEAKKADVTAAEQTRVEYAGGRLVVKTPKRRQYSFFGGRESVDVHIALPAGSHVRAESGVGAVHGTGRLGECRVTTGVGEIQLDRTGPAQLRTGMGDITVEATAGPTDVTTGSGAVRIGTIDGTATVKNSNGDTWVGEVTGDLRTNAANGAISVDRAHAGVSAKTANGDIRLGEVAGGTVTAETAFGGIDIVVRAGVAAWLDLKTSFGHVRNGLETAGAPGPGEETVEVRARTSFGDIDVRRASVLVEQER
jgi:DUF4097 and DUF4098 domain-containing protein YvlB